MSLCKHQALCCSFMFFVSESGHGSDRSSSSTPYNASSFFRATEWPLCSSTLAPGLYNLLGLHLHLMKGPHRRMLWLPPSLPRTRPETPARPSQTGTRPPQGVPSKTLIRACDLKDPASKKGVTVYRDVDVEKICSQLNHLHL